MVYCNPLEAFGINPHDVISLVGCNGKTTLMNLIANAAAQEACYRPVLLSTTTKIRACKPSPTRAVFSSAAEFSAAYQQGNELAFKSSSLSNAASQGSLHTEMQTSQQAYDTERGQLSTDCGQLPTGRDQLLTECGQLPTGRDQLLTGCDQLPAVGVLYGSLLADKTGALAKFGAPSEAERAYALAHANLSLFEADGSRGLPLKGWRDFEPVIDPHTTITIGILPLSAFSLEISPDHICAFDTFVTTFKDALDACNTRTSGANQTDPEFIAHVIQHKRGLFKDAHHTRCIFFINQVDSKQDYRKACSYVESLRLSGVTCDIISGSAQNARFYRMNA